MKRDTLTAALLVAAIVAAGLAAYGSTLTLSFFWEDPFDIGQTDRYSYPQLFLIQYSNSYYRPLTLALQKLMKGGSVGYPPLPYHTFNVVFHLLAAVLLFGAVNYWFNNRATAFASALLFVLYPPGYEAPARASALYSLYVSLAIGALWLYTLGRARGNRAAYFGVLLCEGAFLLLHENGILLPSLILLMELWLRWQKRVPRLNLAVLFYYVPAVLFVAVWLAIPKSGEAPQLGLHPVEALYLSQGLSFPVARLLAQFGGFGLDGYWQAGLAAALAALLLFVLHDPARRPQLALAVALWAVASSLAWVARPIEYLQVSPRVMYFPSFAAALGWAGLAGGGGAARRAVGATLAALVVFQSWLTLGRSVQLYRAGSNLMNQIVAAGEDGERLLFVNAPDRFEYRQPLYPLGYWGMLVAPVSQRLKDFVKFTRGVNVETESLSDFPLLAAMVDASPYRVNTRGVDAHASDLLYDSILWADETYWTDYHPDGAITIRPVGDARPAQDFAKALGRFGGTAEIAAAQAQWMDDSLAVTLRWRAIRSARPTDTIFVHVLDLEGALIGQGDGDSLGGLLPPSAWRAGNEIEDRRTIDFDQPLPAGRYRLTVGLYNRADGQRYPAFDSAGAELANGELEVLQVEKR